MKVRECSMVMLKRVCSGGNVEEGMFRVILQRKCGIRNVSECRGLVLKRECGGGI